MKNLQALPSMAHTRNWAVMTATRSSLVKDPGRQKTASHAIAVKTSMTGSSAGTVATATTPGVSRVHG